MMVHEDCNSEFYELEAAQKIIDFQFIRAHNFFKRLFIFYITCFLFPNFVAYIVDQKTVNKVCCVISLACLLFFLAIEMCQLKKLGVYDYFFDFWNLVDVTQALVFSVTTVLNFLDDD